MKIFLARVTPWIWRILKSTKNNFINPKKFNSSKSKGDKFNSLPHPMVKMIKWMKKNLFLNKLKRPLNRHRLYYKKIPDKKIKLKSVKQYRSREIRPKKEQGFKHTTWAITFIGSRCKNLKIGISSYFTARNKWRKYKVLN